MDERVLGDGTGLGGWLDWGIQVEFIQHFIPSGIKGTHEVFMYLFAF